MPLVLQLHKTEGGTEYAEFLHLPRKRFTDFGNSFCACGPAACLVSSVPIIRDSVVWKDAFYPSQNRPKSDAYYYRKRLASPNYIQCTELLPLRDLSICREVYTISINTALISNICWHPTFVSIDRQNVIQTSILLPSRSIETSFQLIFHMIKYLHTVWNLCSHLCDICQWQACVC
jgi:hypothetical protein